MAVAVGAAAAAASVQIEDMVIYICKDLKNLHIFILLSHPHEILEASGHQGHR